MKPRLSPAATVVLPSFSPSVEAELEASSSVRSARTTSSSGITWAGLKKWRPRKRSGREVAAAWSATDERRGVGGEEGLGLDDRVDLPPHLELRVEVLGDRLDHQVAVGEVARSRAWPGCGRGSRRRRPARACPCRPRGASCFSILPMPLSSASWSTSRTTTSQPAWAQIWAIPWPIRPQPRTPTLLISISRASKSGPRARAQQRAAARVLAGAPATPRRPQRCPRLAAKWLRTRVRRGGQTRHRPCRGCSAARRSRSRTAPAILAPGACDVSVGRARGRASPISAWCSPSTASADRIASRS